MLLAFGTVGSGQTKTAGARRTAGGTMKPLALDYNAVADPTFRRSIPNPRDFFENMLKPSYDEWLLEPLVEWKAKAVVANANILAERLFRYWATRNRTQVAGAGVCVSIPKPFASECLSRFWTRLGYS
jgi:hypothetical protein